MTDQPTPSVQELHRERLLDQREQHARDVEAANDRLAAEVVRLQDENARLREERDALAAEARRERANTWSLKNRCDAINDDVAKLRRLLTRALDGWMLAEPPSRDDSKARGDIRREAGL